MAQAENKKLAYEELNDTATQVANENYKLKQMLNQQNRKMQEMEMFNTFKRMDYIFKIIENSSWFPKDYVEARVDEIKELICDPPKEEDTNE